MQLLQHSDPSPATHFGDADRSSIGPDRTLEEGDHRFEHVFHPPALAQQLCRMKKSCGPERTLEEGEDDVEHAVDPPAVAQQLRLQKKSCGMYQYTNTHIYGYYTIHGQL
jgi:hypothetical protein